jgi:hypothetical protein
MLIHYFVQSGDKQKLCRSIFLSFKSLISIGGVLFIAFPKKSWRNI